MQLTSAAVQQRSTPPDGAPVGITPIRADAEATTTNPQTIAAVETSVDTPSPAYISSAGTIVPPEFRFTETQYEPTGDVTGEELSKLSQDDLLTGLGKQYRNTRNSYGQFGRDLKALVAFYDEVVVRYSNERVSKNRNGEPTLREAFLAIGWNYNAARKMKQRYKASMAALPAYAPAPKPLQLVEGDQVKTKTDGDQGTVVDVRESAPMVNVVFGDDAKPVTVPLEALTKVVVRKIKLNDLILCDDNGAQYKYVGNGKFQRTETPTLIQQKRERELAAIKASGDREAAKASEKKRRDELRKAEAARRDLDKIAEAKAVAQMRKPTKKAKVNAAATKTAKTRLVKVARIGDTREFGVFTESCTEYTTDNALTSGSQQMCEAKRDRINAKRGDERLEVGRSATNAA